MQLKIAIGASDVEAVRVLVEKQLGHRVVQARLASHSRKPSLQRLWRAQLMCLMTTQNKSGLGSAVDELLRQRPFPLSLKRCRAQEDGVEQYIFLTFQNSDRRIRRWKIISHLAALNFQKLEYKGWAEVEGWVDRLWEQRQAEPAAEHYRLERQAAVYLQNHLKGFGPKQSRNFWQSLGLTRYEIPIDSRVLRWSRKNLHLDLPVSGLTDESFYELVMDAFRELCGRAGVWPSVFDAAVFSTFERDGSLPSTTTIDDEDDDG